MSLNICQVGTGVLPVRQYEGAIGKVIYNLANELIKQGDRVRVIDIPDKERKDVPFEVLEIPYSLKLKNVSKDDLLRNVLIFMTFGLHSSLIINKLYKKKQVDLIHFHHQYPAFFGINIAKMRKIPSIYTVHNAIWSTNECQHIKNRTLFFREIYSIKNANMIISHSNAIKENLVNSLKIDGKKIRVIPNGVDTTIFNPDINHDEIKKKLAPNSEKIILCVGRISEQKNQKILLEALPKVLREYYNLKLVFTGSIEFDISYFNALQEIISKFELKKHIIFTGSVSFEELIQIYSSADIFVLPSRAESSSSLVVLEAMACGKPIIASDIPPIREVIGNIGVLINPFNPDELAMALLHLITNEEKGFEMGRRFRQLAVEEYDWSVVAEKTRRVYTELIER